ncbi:MAG: DUF4145 domain-containing protein [Stenotrophomonas acidaminiphila]|jgi:DNA-directed RNA polymerase subunit RPC12/RpoP|uniref:DUF4145 domain-containing protein n=1 Tax=Stenotrophomonas acidaminiphila TaxID=128780 RepID=UPI001AC165F0|nr:DUF4145 domain-containing protein [Stenotrophomonas acidaminiphila]MBN8801221.1 DUF4145 domain-containing protein [Stenotrophomonas acidaminiphila]MDF9440169.1 DUF4145 domain-containing protein [Stenotrophomonas acidaminiphila]
MAWQNPQSIGSKQFRCGYCGYNVANDKGYYSTNVAGRLQTKVCICPNCSSATFFDERDRQYPGVAPGNDVEHVPESLDSLYREARNCCAVSAFTASVLACRKMLMNIAVAQGAKEGLKFIEYVEYLANNGYIPPNGKTWVDHIRRKGNEATHEISLMTQTDAEELVSFVEMLLKFVYEFPSRVPSP